MATDVGMPNGNYAAHYGSIDPNVYAYNANSLASQQQSSQQQPPTSTTPSAPTQPQNDLSKDEVGWYFVEQYYTTLSRSPEKLYLFYNKRSQLVSGQETDKVAVCVGQRAINDKISSLDFQECKVRVTNVDSQASDSNIVIQVIGGMANKGQPHRKFTQTFVLATQTNGYFVLNDIFRYLIDEEDEPEQQETPAAASEDVQQVSGTESGHQEPAPIEAETKAVTSSSDPVAAEAEPKEIESKVEEKLNEQPAEVETAPVVNGDSTHEPKSEETPASVAAPEPVPAAEEERPSAPQADLEPEKPADPEPTPAPVPAKTTTQQQPAAAPKPAAPAAPMSWASRAAAANRVATPAKPVTPAAPASATSATPQSSAPAAKTTTPPSTAASSGPSAATPTAPAAQRQEFQSSESQDEWNTVGPSHNRQQSRQTNVQQEGPQHRGYVKNVMDNVDVSELKAALEKFGKLLYFDVARQKVRLPCYMLKSSS